MKKLLVIALALLFVLPLATGCMGAAAPTKSEGEITVFADAALEEALTKLTLAYTDPEAHEDNKDKSILFSFGASDELNKKLAGGAYCDLFIASSAEAMAGIELLNDSSSELITAADGTIYSVAFMKNSDRVEMSQLYLDFIESAEAKTILDAAGFTVIG